MRAHLIPLALLPLAACSQVDLYTKDHMVGALARYAAAENKLGHLDASFSPLPGGAVVKPPRGGDRAFTWVAYRDQQVCLQVKSQMQITGDREEETLQRILKFWKTHMLIVDQHASLDELPELGEWPKYDKANTGLESLNVVSQDIDVFTERFEGRKQVYRTLHVVLEACLRSPPLTESTNFVSMKFVPKNVMETPVIYIWAVDRNTGS